MYRLLPPAPAACRSMKIQPKAGVSCLFSDKNRYSNLNIMNNLEDVDSFADKSRHEHVYR